MTVTKIIGIRVHTYVACGNSLIPKVSGALTGRFVNDETNVHAMQFAMHRLCPLLLHASNSFRDKIILIRFSNDIRAMFVSRTVLSLACHLLYSDGIGMELNER